MNLSLKKLSGKAVTDSHRKVNCKRRELSIFGELERGEVLSPTAPSLALPLHSTTMCRLHFDGQPDRPTSLWRPKQVTPPGSSRCQLGVRTTFALPPPRSCNASTISGVLVRSEHKLYTAGTQPCLLDHELSKDVLCALRFCATLKTVKTNSASIR